MTQEQIKINQLRKRLGMLLMVNGIQFTKGAYSNLKRTVKPFGAIKDGVANLVSIPVVQRDLNYYFVSKGSLTGMIDIVQGIVKNFKWEKDFFDCDDRSKLVSALFSLLFGVNSCGEAYCRITSLKTGNTYLHWTNVIISSEGDFCLYDVDNRGESTILTKGSPLSMGKYTYEFRSARF